MKQQCHYSLRFLTNVILSFCFGLHLIYLTGCTPSSPVFKPANPQVTPEAHDFFYRLQKLQDKGVMYGHQDDLMYGHHWWYEPGRSDVKETVGDYPAVVGFELGQVGTGQERSLDSVSFKQITEMVKYFHQLNGVITVSWHVINPISSQWTHRKISPNGPGSSWDVRKFKNEPDSVEEFELKAHSLNAVKYILPGGDHHALFNGWLNVLADYFLTWTDESGKLIPFIFRPWHEHSGSFFWWGRERCTDEEYADLWRYTVDYLRNKGLHNILFAYNTDKVYSLEDFMRGYPGDDYVDMLSVDWYGRGDEFYESVDRMLDFVSAAAQEKGKLFALSECDNISSDMINLLKKYKISYFLTWRNAPIRAGMPSYPVMEGRINEWNRQLKLMYDDKHTMFLNDIQ